jgi:hypothetical protein
MNKDVNKHTPPTFIRVYNPVGLLTKCKDIPDIPLKEGFSLLALGFIKKIKTFSYNKKDLA